MRRAATRLLASLVCAAAAWAAGCGDPAPDPAPTAAPPAAPVRDAAAPRARAVAPAPSTAPETHPSPPAETGRKLTVRVEDDAGPVAGAGVHARGQDGVKRAATTDATGVARFEGVPEGAVLVEAWAAGTARASADPDDVAPTGDAECRLRLVPAGRLSGCVRDADGNPVPGAEVHTSSGDGSLRFSGRAGADGSFVLDGLPAAAGSWLWVRAPRHAKHELYLDRPVTGLDVRLGRAGRISGTVRDAEGAPVAGAAVEALVAGRPPPGLVFADERLRTESGAEGTYAFDDVPHGVPYELTATAEGHTASAPTAVTLSAERPDAVADAALRRLARLEVRLLGLPAGHAARGHVRCTVAGGAEVVTARVESPLVVVEAQVVGACTVTADVPGFVAAPVPAELRAGETTTVDLALTSGAFVAGVVVDDAGAPVPGATVRALHREGRIASFGGPGPAHLQRWATSGSDGRFRIEALPAGDVAVWAEADGHGETGWRWVVPPAEDVRIVAPRLGTVRFEIAAPADLRPPQTFRLSTEPAEALEAVEEGRTGGCVEGAEWSGGPLEKRLTPGAWRVTVQFDGYAPVGVEAKVAPGATTTLPKFAITRGATLRGRVVDDAGRPVAGAHVWTGFHGTETDAEGRFEVPRVAPGRVQVGADGPRHVVARVVHTFTPGEPPLVVVVRPGGIVRGVLRDTAGRPLAEVPIAFRALGGDLGTAPRRDSAVTEADGTFGVRVAPGPWRVEVVGIARPAAAKDVEVREGETVSVELAVDP